MHIDPDGELGRMLFSDYDASGEDENGRAGEGRRAEMTFANFAVGHPNEAAAKAALAVAERPGEEHSPLFVYGKSGTGKTHLLKAIEGKLAFERPELRVRYATAMQFVGDHVKAIGGNDFVGFNERYHDLDVLLVDDFQLLEGREATVAALYSIVDDMLLAGKQVVLASNRPPLRLDLDTRMVARFSSGPIVGLTEPGWELRRGILEKALARESRGANLQIPDDALDWMAYVSSSNGFVLVGEAKCLVGVAKGDGLTELSLSQVQDALASCSASFAAQPQLRAIREAVASVYDCLPEELGPEMRPSPVFKPHRWGARNVAIYLSRYLTEESLTSIGDEFGALDHAEIMRAVDRVEKELSQDESFAANVGKAGRLALERLRFASERERG